MKSLLRLVAIVAAATMLCSGTAQSQPKDKVVLMLNWYLYSEHAPFFLGMIFGEFTLATIWTLISIIWDTPVPSFPWP